MKTFLDTSVFVATFFQDHQFHERSLELFLRCTKANASCGAHSLAEVYSTLTGVPGNDKVAREEALLFLGNIRDRFTIVALTQAEYFKGVELSAAAGVWAERKDLGSTDEYVRKVRRDRRGSPTG